MKSRPLFCALARRLERVQGERRAAKRSGNQELETVLFRRCQVLIGAILDLPIS